MLELMPPFYFLTFAKVSVSVSKTFGLKKSLGISLENISSKKKVSVSVSKIFGLKKSLSLENFGLKKVSVSVSMKFFGLVTQCTVHQHMYYDRGILHDT